MPAACRQRGRGTRAYGVLYDRYARLIRAVCHDATSDLTEAQDLAQEVFLRAYQNLGRLRDGERFAGWLVGIARMTCREWRRRQRRERDKRKPLDADLAAPAADADDSASLHLLAAIAKLPRQQRIALHLFYLQERPVEDAREVMNVSRSGFYRILDRARRRLRRIVDPRREGTP